MTDLAPFLAPTAVIDFEAPSVARLAETIRRDGELATIQAAYELVRDGLAHSYDTGAQQVSVSARIAASPSEAIRDNAPLKPVIPSEESPTCIDSRR